MLVCNTGLNCEDCVGGCEQNLEVDDELEMLQLEHTMCTFMNIKFKGMSFEEAEKQAVSDVKESRE